VQAGDPVRVTQDGASVVLPAALEKTLPANTVRVPAATVAAATLGALFGNVAVEKAIDLSAGQNAPATATV